MKNIVLTALLFFFFKGSWAQPSGYGFGKQILIQSSQVSGSTAHSNFPVLISFTDNDLRTTANSGNVENANGYDIIFTLSDCSTILDHEIESYDPVTGKYIAWVRIPSLPATMDFEIHMYYGNSSISVDPTTTNTWNSDYFGVYHFNNSVSDGTSKSNNLVDSSTTNFVSSKIGEGRDLNNSTNVNSSSAAGQHLIMPNGILAGVGEMTFSGWVLLDRNDTNWERIFDFGQNTSVNFFFTPSNGAGSPAQARARIRTATVSEQGPIVGNTVAGTGVWVYWSVQVDPTNSTIRIYRNSNLYGNISSLTLSPNDIEASTSNYFGRSQYPVDHYIDAKFDEFRLSNTIHSADWIATEYNNQNSPPTFYTVSAEFTAATLCSSLPIELVYFSAELFEDHKAMLRWQTASEINNDYFTVERSRDGQDWEELEKVQGAGNSTTLSSYSAIDKTPYGGISYYRLKQTDFDRQYEYSQIISVNTNKVENKNILISPNPVSNLIRVTGSLSELNQLRIYNTLGQDVTDLTKRMENESDTKLVIDLSNLHAGVYYIITKTTTNKVYKQ